MKKITKALLSAFILCSTVFFGSSAYAQFSGGIRAGANLATQQYPGFTMGPALLGYGGAFVRCQIHQIAFQLEVDYSAEGGNLEVQGSNVINKYRDPFLNIPLFIQAWSPTGGYIEFGAQYGSLISSTYNYNNTGTVNIRSAYKSDNFSLGGGIGYEFKNKSVEGLGINFRFMQGITAISKSGNGDIKNGTFSLGVSKKF